MTYETGWSCRIQAPASPMPAHVAARTAPADPNSGSFCFGEKSSRSVSNRIPYDSSSRTFRLCRQNATRKILGGFKPRCLGERGAASAGFASVAP